jgi:PRTRC genetic system protein E
MFSKLSLLLNGKPATIVVQQKDEVMSVMVTISSDKDDNIKPKPIIMRGTPQEIDENFLSVIEKPLQALSGFITNVEDVVEDMEEQVKEAKEKPAKAASKSKSKKVETKDTELDVAEKEPSEVDKLLSQSGTHLTNNEFLKAIELLLKAEKLEPKNEVVKQALYSARLNKQKFEAGFVEQVNTPVIEEKQVMTPNQNFDQEKPLLASQQEADAPTIPGFDLPEPQPNQTPVQEEQIIPKSINEQFSF